MTGPTLAQLNAIRDLANQYSAIPEQFLLEAFGREPSLDEFSAFIEASVANILGGMYGILRESKNPKEAEAWLKQTLGLTSALVRKNGSEALLKFDVTVKEAPNTLHKKPDPAERAPASVQTAPTIPASSECKCQIDGTGVCLSCSRLLAAYFQAVFQPFMKMKELAEQTKGMCTVCQPAQTDHAMSTVVPGLLKLLDGASPDEKKTFSQEILAALYSMAMMMGAKALPLTDQAYTKAVGNPEK